MHLKNNINSNTQTIWDKFKDYINSFEDEDLITRKNMITSLRDVDYYFAKKRNVTTIDTYKNYVTQGEFLETVSPGTYKKLRSIPKNLTLSILKKVVYERKWILWFAKPEDWCIKINSNSEVKNG